MTLSLPAGSQWRKLVTLFNDTSLNTLTLIMRILSGITIVNVGLRTVG